jgi:UDP-N-acetylglucosamine 4,6-dehydratase
LAHYLVTGATGSFGKKLLKALVGHQQVERITAFSRDELKQFVLQNHMPGAERIHWVIGDVRDRDSLLRATRGVDVIIHAAALKQVVACEQNPLEAIKTNVIGASNVIQAAIANGVTKVVALSTDKAVNPVNLYGATKLCAEKLITAADHGLNSSPTRFSCVRWGNVIGSRGSVIPFFLESAKSGVVKITDVRMTRFWITLEQAVAFVLRVVDWMQGGEVFVPKVPSMKVIDVANTVAPAARIELIGVRPGEKLHEVLITNDESRHCYEFSDGYLIASELKPLPHYDGLQLKKTTEGWVYSSDQNTCWLTSEDLKRLMASTTIEEY